MVEGAVIFPIMASMMIMFELAHHSFDAYITVGHVVRERTWSAATTGSLIGNCGAGARDDQTYTATESYFSIPAGGATSNGQAGPAPSYSTNHSPPGNLPGSNGFFNYSADATANISVHRGGRSFNHTAQSHEMVYCNQKFYGSIITIIENAL
jgi:hypothetical protein